MKWPSDESSSIRSLIGQWFLHATNDIVILDKESNIEMQAILERRIGPQTVLSVFGLYTGGILIDHECLRLLGAECERMTYSVINFNALCERALINPPHDAFIVGYDSVGGVFAINGGSFDGPMNGIFYLAPDSLSWESLEMEYSDLLSWASSGDLVSFYRDLRWPGWEWDIAEITADHGFAIYPLLCAKEGGPVASRARRVVPVTELVELHMRLSGEFRGASPGTAFRISVVD